MPSELPGEIRDITIIGAGPVGLSTAFWAGMREASSRIVDSLPQIGGQLTALYPEKWIFDVPGHPKVLAKDLVESLRRQALEQFDVPVHLETTIESIDWEDDIVVLRTNNPHFPELRSRAVIIAGGHGAFEPKKLPGYDLTPWEGRGVHYLVGSKSEFAGKRVLIIGGGDSACDWVVNLLHTAESVALCHRREGFRAHELTVNQVMEAAEAGHVDLHVPYQVREVSGNGAIERVRLFHSEDETRDRDRGRRDPPAARLQDRARPAEGVGHGDLQGRDRRRPGHEDEPAAGLGVRRHHDLRRASSSSSRRASRSRRSPSRRPCTPSARR